MAERLAAAANNRFRLHRAEERGSFADDVRAGLASEHKSIPPRYFYDDVGSSLFDVISRLPEYYVTRAEKELLISHGREIAHELEPVNRLVELGSGSGRKTRLLLDALTRGGRPLEYVPVDVDGSVLEQMGNEMLRAYPTLTVTALASDFRLAARSLRSLPAAGRTAVLFLGSTLGNLDGEEAGALFGAYRDVAAVMLLGADLRKPKPIIDAAYNDVLGVTAAFNLNLLQRINRELGGEFDLRSFAHRAFYDEERCRVEMHLVSLREQRIRIASLDLEVPFKEGETIHTENSYKYDDGAVAALAGRGGFHIAKRWTDSRGWFGEYLLV